MWAECNLTAIVSWRRKEFKYVDVARYQRGLGFFVKLSTNKMLTSLGGRNANQTSVLFASQRLLEGPEEKICEYLSLTTTPPAVF